MPTKLNQTTRHALNFYTHDGISVVVAYPGKSRVGTVHRAQAAAVAARNLLDDLPIEAEPAKVKLHEPEPETPRAKGHFIGSHRGMFGK